MESSRENSFWKHNGRVPGRPSPKKENKLLTKSAKGPIGSTSFQDFQNSVRDAWDIGDDEFCIVSEMSSKCRRRVDIFFYFHFFRRLLLSCNWWCKCENCKLFESNYIYPHTQTHTRILVFCLCVPIL